jgi:hypothetical protein
VTNVIASLLGTLVLVWYAWRRRTDWFARRFTRDDQLVAIFFAVTLANAAIQLHLHQGCDSQSGGNLLCNRPYGCGESVDIDRHGDGQPCTSRGVDRPFSSSCLARGRPAPSAYTSRCEATGGVVRNEWVYVDDWIEGQGLKPDAAGLALKRQLQADAISKHPMRPVVLGEWVQWFRE